MIGAMPAHANWDTYFLELARQAATRSSCSLARHGAVIVNRRHVRSTGYNGTPSGYANCDAGGCPRGRSGDRDKPCTGLHAEANAILFAAPADRDGATIYITAPPCFECARLIANSGIREMVSLSDDSAVDFERTRGFLLDCNVRVRVLDASTVGVPR